MAFANNGVTVTPGVGTEISTQSADDKEAQVIITAAANGHLHKTLDTYYYFGELNVGAQNKIHLTLFNGASSGVIIRVRGLYLQCGLHDADTPGGVTYRFDLDTITAAGTGGTDLTGRETDSNNAAIPAEVTAEHASASGATKGFTLFPVILNDTNLDNLASAHIGRVNLLQQGEHIQDLVLYEGEGLRLIQITANAIAQWAVHAIVTIEEEPA